MAANDSFQECLEQNVSDPIEYSRQLSKELKRVEALVSGNSELVSAKSDNYTVLDDDHITTILMTTGASDKTVTLPVPANNIDRKVSIKKVDVAIGDCIVSGPIDGLSSYTMSLKDETVTLQCDGVGWFVINKHIPTVAIRYGSNISQPIPNVTQTRLDYETKDYDTGNTGGDLVTTGPSWQFLVPKTGYYDVASFVNHVSGPKVLGKAYTLQLGINGSPGQVMGQQRSEINVDTIDSVIGAATAFLTKGDTVQIFDSQNNLAARATWPSVLFVWVTIRLVG